jgi:hypothetical protein
MVWRGWCRDRAWIVQPLDVRAFTKVSALLSHVTFEPLYVPGKCTKVPQP